MSIAATAEQLALRAAIRDWAARTGTLQSVRAREPSVSGPSAPGDKRQWQELAGLGVFSIALPEWAGGAGATVADLAAACEELTLALAPGPVLPSILAGLVLAGNGPAPTGTAEDAGNAGIPEFLTALAEGAATATVAVSPDGLTGTWADDGTLEVSGETGPVLSGGPDAHLLAAAATADGDAWFLVPPGHPGVTITDRAPVDFSRPLAAVRCTHAVIKSRQILKSRDSQGAQAAPAPEDLAAALFSVEAAAVARWCCDTAAAYARTRRQFGRPIGEFQAVKHLCATMLCRAQEAAALADDAIRAADEARASGSPGELPLAAAAAAANALDAAVGNAKDCVQVLGGIGFTWEHDAHLYLRRAVALRHLLGGGAKWRERAAALALDGARRHLSLDVTGSAAAESARSVLNKIVGAEDQRKALADEGYVAPHWPAPYGIGASPGDVLAIDEEFARAKVNRPDLVIGGWAGQAIVQYGTAEQKERFLGPTVRGEITWCQLFSEPEAGSDLASLRTKATKTDGGWVLNGQKVWTSLAHEADWAICIARTDPDVPKHKGLTFFLVDMGSEGLDIRPLREMTGRALFNEVFLDQVFVPDDRVLGRPGEGWRVTRATLAAERVAMSQGSSFGEEVEALLARVRSAGLTGDRRVLEKIGGLVSGALGGSLLDFQMAQARLSGTDDGDSAAVRKILGVGHRQAVAETALELCGPEGATVDADAADPVHEFLLTRCLSIAGGTTQILLTVVAERVLGLPRLSRPVAKNATIPGERTAPISRGDDPPYPPKGGPLTVDFTPTETQRDIGDLTRQVLVSGGWKELAQADLLSLALPSWLDGNGFGIDEVAALLSEVGRSGASVPAYATLALGVLPVVAWADRSLAEDLLAGVGAGEKVLTAAVREPGDPFPARPSVTVSGRSVAGRTVSGTKVGVPYAAEAARVLVPASLGDGSATVVVIDPADASVTRTHTAGGEPEYTLKLENVPVRGVLAEGAAEGLYRFALAGALAVADGAVAAALDLTREHIGSREQFGRPLATFQAAAQHIADVYITARTLHLAVTSACWRLGQGLEAESDLNVAAYWLASRAPEAMLTCHHLHGGLGMDVTYPMPRYSGLVKDLVRLVGGADYRLDRLAASREGA